MFYTALYSLVLGFNIQLSELMGVSDPSNYWNRLDFLMIGTYDVVWVIK